MKKDDSCQADTGVGRVGRILEEIEAAIKELPLMEMIDSVQAVGAPKSKSVRVMAEQVVGLIDNLESYARTGQEEAIESLSKIGLHVSEALKSVGKTDEVRAPSNQFSQELYTVVRIDGDFSKVNEILSQEIEFLVSSIELKESIQERSVGFDFGEFVIDVMDSLYWRNDVANKAHEALIERYDKEDRPVEVPMNHPSERMRFIEQSAEILGLVERSKIPSLKAEILIHKWMRRILERRFSSLSRKERPDVFKRLASHSIAWPISASALDEINKKTLTYLESLDLGNALPFRMYRSSKGGPGRSFKPGSPASFALSYCLSLEEVRIENQGLPPDERESIRKKVKATSNRHRCSSGTSENHDEGLADLMKLIPLHDRWRGAAALLPQFPQADGTKTSERDFQEWLKAAIFLAEFTCGGDWENYSWWPECVLKRSGGDKRPRSKRESVGEKLRIGMRKLQE